MIDSIADSYEHTVFFKDNFEMEATAAGYSVTQSQEEADYTLQLQVTPNMIMYDDGTEEPVPPDEKQFVLAITVLRNETNTEIISFSFLFSELEEMYEYTLFLLYEAMANVPLVKGNATDDDEDRWAWADMEPEVVIEERITYVYAEESDAWRNKWLYVRVSADYQVTTYRLREDGLHGKAALMDPNDGTYLRLSHSVIALPGATLGLEFQFLNWLSTELDLRLRFGDPVSYAFIPGLQLGIKFPLKPGTLMIEPYIAATFSMGTADHYVAFPNLGVGGGIQIATKAGEMGGVFFAVNYVHTLDDMITKNTDSKFTDPSQIHWGRSAIGFSLGYKLGFVNRPRKNS